jgi:hypothetical protein
MSKFRAVAMFVPVHILKVRLLSVPLPSLLIARRPKAIKKFVCIASMFLHYDQQMAFQPLSE